MLTEQEKQALTDIQNSVKEMEQKVKQKIKEIFVKELAPRINRLLKEVEFEGKSGNEYVYALITPKLQIITGRGGEHIMLLQEDCFACANVYEAARMLDAGLIKFLDDEIEEQEAEEREAYEAKLKEAQERLELFKKVLGEGGEK